MYLADNDCCFSEDLLFPTKEELLNCWEPLDCIRDWSGSVEGYGLYYCPKCDKIN